jgi:hypothetical protein
VYFEGGQLYRAEFMAALLQVSARCAGVPSQHPLTTARPSCPSCAPQDLVLVVGSVAFMFFYIWFQVDSMALALAAMAGMLLSFPTVLFFYLHAGAHTTMGILNFVR